MTFDQEQELVRRVEFKMLQEKKEIARQAKVLQEENLEKTLKKQKVEATKVSLERLREKQKEALDTKSLPIRTYLFQNVMDILADGLYNICKTQPEDPVDTLAEYLFKRSLDVAYPDPSTF